MRGVFRLSRLAGAVVVIGLALGLSQAGAITNGSYDGNNHPNVGIMFLRAVPATAGFCSGSLLSAHEFLTAGHCTQALSALGLAPDQIYVSFDEQVSLSPEFVISAAHPIAVTGWVTHPGFRGTSLAGPAFNDVGVIHLAEAMSLTPIELPEVGFLDTQAARGELRDHAFVDVGYGLNSLDRSLSSPQVNITWEHRRMATSSPFMALTPTRLEEHGGICAGDSGGPAFYGGSDPSLVVATVTDGDEVCGPPAVFQRLDTQSVRDFLDQYR